MSLQSFKEKIQNKLVENGFEVVDKISMYFTNAIAQKSYKTKVGDKEAVVRFTSCEDENYATLTAEYQSEGRNILSSCITNLDNNLSEEFLDDLVKSFSIEVNKKVDDSYARKLYKNKKIKS